MKAIRAGRVRELLKLARDVWEFDPATQEDRRSALVARLASLVGAEVAVFVEDRHFRLDGSGPLAGFSGHNAEPLVQAVGAIVGRRTSSPHFEGLIKVAIAQPKAVVSLRRRDCVDARIWYSSELFDSCFRPNRVDDSIAAIKTIGRDGHVLGFNLIRAARATPFTEEDCSLLELFTEECSELLNVPDPTANWRLTPREREVLRGLLQGLSNKELAVRLDCSVRTVETHLASLLRKSGAESRAQVVARALARPRRPGT